MDLLQTLGAYERAWAQSKEAEIRAWLQECWTATSTYVNPLTDMVRGIDGLTSLILDYPVMFPDAAIRPRSEPDVHHDFVRHHWRLSSTQRIRMLGRDFGRAVDGVDIIQLDDTGKISCVVSFFAGPTSGADPDHAADHSRGSVAAWDREPRDTDREPPDQELEASRPRDRPFC